MEKSLDSGDIIYQSPIDIEISETYRSLYDKLSIAAYRVVNERINSLFSTNVPAMKQNEALVTLAPNITREDEKIN
jgi:methionyl-tRNA formyltransferase